MMKIRDWFHKVSRRRTLLRIDRLMGLSDMKLGKKTRKCFLRLRRSVNIKRNLLKLSDRVNDLGEFWDIELEYFLTGFMMYYICIFIISFIISVIGLQISLLYPIVTAFISLAFTLPIVLFFVKILINFLTTSPSDYDWLTSYKSRLTRTGPIGKVMNRLWKNNNGSGVKSNNDNRFFSNYFEGFNQMASLLNMNMDYLDKPEYWSDEDYGRFMRIILSYAFIYESADGHPDKEVLSEFINSDEVQSTAREVLDDVRERKDRICGTDTNKDTNTDESSSIADNPDPVAINQTNDRTDPNIIRSEDIQSRIVGKTDRLHNILDSEMQIEK